MHKTGVPYFIKIHLLQYYSLIDLHHLVCFSLNQYLLLHDFREKTNIFYTIFCEGMKNNPVNKERGDTNENKHCHSRCRAAALPCRETAESSPKVSGTFETVLRVSALLCKKYEVTYLCRQIRLNITNHIVSSKKGRKHKIDRLSLGRDLRSRSRFWGADD